VKLRRVTILRLENLGGGTEKSTITVTASSNFGDEMASHVTKADRKEEYSALAMPL